MKDTGGRAEVRLRYWWFVVAVLAILFAGSIFGESSVRADEPYDQEELKFLELINQYRQSKGLPTLVLSDTLAVASKHHSEDMGRYNFFAHNTAKSSYFPAGSTPWDRMKLSGYDYPNSFKAENLVAGYETAEQNFRAWRGSPGHDRNMLDGNPKVIGIARVHVPGSKHGWYWTTDFGSEVDSTSHAPGESPRSEQRASAKTDKAQDLKQDQDGVENGSMNSGDGVWKQETVKEGKKLIRNEVARLGGYDDARDEISQKIHIQEGQNLSYRVRILTKERERPADILLARLTDEAGKHLATLKIHTSADVRKAGRDGWIRESVDLSRFTDETVNLDFLARTDGERPTTFYVDDVELK